MRIRLLQSIGASVAIVSVGEALTARALAADLKARYPRLRLFLSTTTITGQQVARRSLPHVDDVFYQATLEDPACRLSIGGLIHVAAIDAQGFRWLRTANKAAA